MNYLSQLLIIIVFMLFRTCGSAQYRILNNPAPYNFLPLVNAYTFFRLEAKSDYVSKCKNFIARQGLQQQPCIPFKFSPIIYDNDAPAEDWKSHHPACALTAIATNNLQLHKGLLYATVDYYRWVLTGSDRRRNIFSLQQVGTDVWYRTGNWSTHVFTLLVAGSQRLTLTEPSFTWNKDWWQGKSDWRFTSALISDIGNNVARPVLLQNSALKQVHLWPLVGSTTAAVPLQIGWLDYGLSSGIELHKNHSGFRLVAAACRTLHRHVSSNPILTNLTLGYAYNFNIKPRPVHK